MSAYKHLLVEIKDNFAIVGINRGPVNAMNLDLWTDLLKNLEDLEGNKKIRGVIYTSALTKDIFTAGNDLTELYPKTTTKERFTQFWTISSTFLSRLYASRLATVAAIKGQCPAGGTILALCCDYRIMTVADKGAQPRIGFNEVAIGLPVPPFFVELYVRMLGRSKAEHLLMTGETLDAIEAQKAGLVHETVTKDKLLERAEAVVKGYLKYPDGGRVATKLNLREEASKKWFDNIPKEIEFCWGVFSDAEAMKKLGQVIQSLSGGKPAAAPAKPQSKL